MPFLINKKAVITGGTSGLGAAIARRFLEEGAHVALWGRNGAKGDSFVEELNRIRSDPMQKVCFDAVDVGNMAAVTSAFETVHRSFGGVDIIVNCAGITRDKLFIRMDEEDWDAVLETNLKSVFNVCKAGVRPMMKQRFGRIINISSVIGLTGNPGQVNYSASKSGMIGFTKSLAKEVASRGITVNSIAPGFFKTEMTESLQDAQREEILRKIPMNRMGEPREVADAALFLASSLADYITGQTITVDGGMLA